MSTSLKKEFLELLEKDIEFRYAVAGYLGLLEILKRLDKLEEGQKKLWESQNRLWEEIKALREDQNKLWENQNRLWEEVRALREGQEKIWEEVKALREGQNKLWENQNRLWESQNRLWKEVKSLREGQNKLWTVFRELGRAVGMTLDHYTDAFLRAYLEEKGYPPERISLSVDARLMINNRFIEVDIFSLDPLIIGEVTTYIRSRREAENEIEKLLEKRRLIESAYKRSAEMTVLTVANVEEEAIPALREAAEKKGITVFTGREIKPP
ncbi:hypothetical protein J7L29_00525 [Candidatus Bathyarchaeota archaeon]|nr:hypothetical protein [Candidatus Bathyarchaeota archaeon]